MNKSASNNTLARRLRRSNWRFANQ